MRLGRSSARAASMAASMAARSLPSSTRWVCQPYASNRFGTSSDQAIAVGPSSWTWLSSYSTTSLPRRRWPARLAASELIPSWRSPSEAMT